MHYEGLFLAAVLLHLLVMDQRIEEVRTENVNNDIYLSFNVNVV